ncbi:hypothetical protein [Undibacterium sp. TS12]|uniref:hypothetical protein n=1 Tax=Undibacterium sp. TS12 TaxID=2908202 RepID=UPI001F4D1BD9|nr:hypothetical protein [Undibacterium sp. TS12]MCH8620607.1 hypothetical protein [Undibacterium sp. TS12]
MKKFILSFASLIFCVSSAQADTNSPADNRVFDWRFYLYSNPDLIQAGLTTEFQALQHWSNNGIYEGRQAHPAFHTRQYLDKYADLKAAFGLDYSKAVSHFLQYGYAEGRIGYFEAGASNQNNYLDKYQRITISNKTTGQWANPVYVSMSGKFAGAIDSIYWGGKEFINSHDHGRQVQYAWQYASDLQNVSNPAAWNYNWSIYRGECDNPTEAGDATDGVGYFSKSYLSSYSFNGNTFSTSSIPAYWSTDNASYSAQCGAKYTSGLSNDTLNKNVSIFSNYPANLIKVVASILPENIPRKNVPSRYEVPALYLNPEFTKFFYYKNSGVQQIPAVRDPLCSSPIGNAQWAFGEGCEALSEYDGPIIATDSANHYIGAIVVKNSPNQYKAITYAFYQFITENNKPGSDPTTRTTKIGPVVYTNSGTARLDVTTYIAVGSSFDAVRNTLIQAQTSRP